MNHELCSRQHLPVKKQTDNSIATLCLSTTDVWR